MNKRRRRRQRPQRARNIAPLVYSPASAVQPLESHDAKIVERARMILAAARSNCALRQSDLSPRPSRPEPASPRVRKPPGDRQGCSPAETSVKLLDRYGRPPLHRGRFRRLASSPLRLGIGVETSLSLQESVEEVSALIGSKGHIRRHSVRSRRQWGRGAARGSGARRSGPRRRDAWGLRFSARATPAEPSAKAKASAIRVMGSWRPRWRSGPALRAKPL